MTTVSLFGMVLFLIVISLNIFWLWMLIDCAVKEPSVTGKLAWILIILFTNVIGALIYYVIRRPARIREHGR